MLKYVLLVLMLGFIAHAENVDVSSYSASKKVARIKRQFAIPHEPRNKKEQLVVVNEKDTPQNVNNVGNDEKKSDDAEGDKINKDNVVNVLKTVEHSSTTENNVNNIVVNKNDTDMHTFPISPHGREHIGAAMRSFWVFLGLSLIVVVYFTFRAFKTRPGAPPPNTVRKYGVVGRRGDLEMLPLPLNEEDDDDTLFDAAQQQNR